MRIRLVSWFRFSPSNKQSSTPVAFSENSAKFTPDPSQVAPSGYGLPGHTFIKNLAYQRTLFFMLQRFAQRCPDFPDSRRNRGYLAQITDHGERNGQPLSRAMKKNSTVHRIE